jgi:hypothetical protein
MLISLSLLYDNSVNFAFSFHAANNYKSHHFQIKNKISFFCSNEGENVLLQLAERQGNKQIIMLTEANKQTNKQKTNKNK